MRFLTKRDFASKIKDDQLDIITEADDTLIDDVEAAAIKLMGSYLSARYDTAKIFLNYLPFTAGEANPIGTVLYDLANNAFYTVKTADAGDDLTNADHYTKGDPRDALVRSHLVDIVLYELFCRIKPRFIPEYRIQRRDDVVKWLKDVQDPRNNVNADLPLLEFQTRTGNDISWNSRPKQYNKY